MSDNSGNSGDSHRLKDKHLAEHVAENRSYWDSMASDWVGAGQRSWQQDSPTWGIWGLPESQLQLLPVDMTGMKAIELGCGTGYVSAWMTRRGAHVTGIDNSLEQLKTAERLMKEYELEVDFIHGDAEDVPYPDASFDFAISEYGAAIWCDPLVWIPEAYRLLKPGGWLTFLGSHPIAIMATPEDGSNCDERLHRPYFGMHQQDGGMLNMTPAVSNSTCLIRTGTIFFKTLGLRCLTILNYRHWKTARRQNSRYRQAGAKNGLQSRSGN